MKKNQKYVAQCHTPVLGRRVGLGEGVYKKGAYVTEDGTPTMDIQEAYVYTHGDPWEDFFAADDFDLLAKHFRPAPVELIIMKK